MLEAKIRNIGKSTIIQLVFKSEDEPEGLNLRSFECFDWSWNLTEDHRYFVIGYSDTFVMSDSCIVDHVIMQHGDPVKMEESLMTMLNKHTPEEFSKRLYAYCKETLKADSNTAANEQPIITYSVATAKGNTFVYYRTGLRDWTPNYMDTTVFKTPDFNKFLAFIDTLDLSTLSNELYMAKHTETPTKRPMLGASGPFEFVRLKDLFKKFLEIPKFR